MPQDGLQGEGEASRGDEAWRLHVFAERRFFELLLSRDCEYGDALDELAREYEADDNAPAVSRAMLEEWSAAERWEQAFEALTLLEGPALECLRADVRLLDAVDDARDARAVWLVHQAVARGATASLPDVQKHRLAWQTLTEAEEKVRGLEENLKRTVGLTPVPVFRQQQEELLGRLRAQYGDLGPQYEVLVYRLAAAETRLRQLEATGVAEGKEYQDVTRLVIEVTNQLQKFTETQKTEVIVKQRQEAILGILEYLERRIAPEYPNLWAGIVREIAAQLQGQPLPLPAGAAA